MKEKRDLKDIIRRAYEYGKVLVNDGDILQSEAGYIDTRTKLDAEAGIHVVKPICFNGGYYEYICPDCADIHGIHKDLVRKPINIGCCANHKRSNKRMALVEGKIVRVKRPKIMLDYKGR